MICLQPIGTFKNIYLVLALVFIFSGCATEPTKTSGVEQGVAAEQRGGSPSQQAQPSVSQGKQFVPAEKGAEKQETVMCLCEQYTVRKGDSLWWIAKYRDIYNDPFLWPILYEANKDIIKNPKLLYPGQELDIPRGGYKLEEIKGIRMKAGAAKPYLPPQQANLPVD